jgi:hypothetical protein
MITRYASLVAALLATEPAFAENLNADAAQRFVVGRMFSYTCFDGTRGAGRILSDGSVVGTIQVRGSGPVHPVSLPPGTLRIKGDAVCGVLNSIPIEPCFDLDKTDDQSFRGSISGLGAAYCEFTRLNDIAVRPPRQRPSEPLSLDLRRWRRAAP